MKRLKHGLIVALAVQPVGAQLLAEGDILVTINFSNTPISQVAGLYEHLTGRTVIVSDDALCTFTFRSTKRLSEEKAISLVESNLVARGIAIVRKETSIELRPDPAKFKPEAVVYSEAETNASSITVIRRPGSVAPRRTEQPMPPGDYFTPEEKFRRSTQTHIEAKGERPETEGR